MPTNKFKKGVIIFLILFLLLFGFRQIYWYTENSRTESELDSLITEGLNFYSEAVIKDLKIDSYLFFREIIKHSKGDQGLFYENSYEKDLFSRILNKEKYITDITFSKPDKYSYEITPKYEQASEEPFGSILLKALYCDISGYTDEDFSILKSFNLGDGSYFDTHFLISLLFLKGNGCYQPDLIEKSIKEVSASIIYAQKNDISFSDLYAERIVVLYWAGYGENIEEDWINIVKDNFKKEESGWRADSGSSYSNPHTTGLAILSLVYFLEEKPEQHFY